MNIRNTLLALALLPLALLAQELPKAETSRNLELNPDIRVGKLPNGLTYFILKNAKPEKRMELRLAVNAGSTEEEDDQQGLAHFVEHMAFNGTAHFKKNQLVDYLESIGTKFGPHLNAYTSFDETVYMMQVPTDSQETFNKSFQILEDWAHGLSFDSNEVNKERGVVIEEWRLGQGAFERMRNVWWPILFAGSKYERRLPIGKKEILEKAANARLRAFYKDWYRPNLMAVVAVGDFDMDVVEAKIKAHFSPLTNPAKEKKLTKWEVAVTPPWELARARDKEAPYTSVQIIYKVPAFDVKTEGDYRKWLQYRLLTGMINSRLEEKMNKPNAPFNYASTNYSNIVRTLGTYSSFAIVKETNILKAISALLEENERAIRFGFGMNELERQKKQMMRSLERAVNEQNKTESGRLIGGIVSYYLNGRPYMGANKDMELFLKYANTIRPEEFIELTRQLIDKDGNNAMIIIQAPDKEGFKLPDDEDIRKTIKKVPSIDIKPYDDVENSSPFIAKLPTPGTIVSETKDSINGITEFKLSNGAVVAYKRTEFKNDEIQFRAISKGGASLYDEKDDMSASEASGIITNSGLGTYSYSDLSKWLKGKIANVRPYIFETGEGMSGSSSQMDLEFMMQLVYQYFTAPRKDTSGFKSYMDQQKAFVENRQLDPESAYEDTIETIMSSHHPRRRPWTPALLKEINHDRAYAIFKERFSNAGDFTFLFVGNIPEDVFRRLIQQYIGSIPGTSNKENWADVGIETPKGTIKKTVKRGSEPKSSVTMKFTGPAVYRAKESMDLKVLMKLMSIRLRETLREDNSGTYGVSCNGSISRIPKEEFTVTVSFGCAPDNISLLTKAAMKVIDEVKELGCEEKNLIKVKETFRREREVSLKENGWWMNTMVMHYNMNDPYPSQAEFDAYFQNLKSTDFADAAKKYFSKDNYAYFTWEPAN